MQYREIDDFSQIDSLRNTDMFLVARPDQSEIQYSTFHTTWNQVFNALSSNVQIKTTALATTFEELKPNVYDKGVGANLGYQLNAKINEVSANALNKNITTNITISGSANFKKSPTVPSISSPTTPNNTNKYYVINFETLKNYVDYRLNAARIPAFTAMFTKQDLSGRQFILSDVLPLAGVASYAQAFTLILKFKDTGYSASNVKVDVKVNPASQFGQATMAGSTPLHFTKATKTAPAVDNSFWHSRWHITLPANANPNTISWTIDNINSSVDVSMALYYGHI